MSYDHVCPYCDSTDTVETSYAEDVKFGRRKINVVGLHKLVCRSCESESVTGQMHDANLALIKEASQAHRGAVSIGMLRTFRDTWHLSQKDASAIFGAGKSSFAKWESGQAKLSTPSALLIQLAIRFPVVVPYLAKLARTTLAQDCEGWTQRSATVDVIAPRTHTLRARAAYVPFERVDRVWGQKYAVNDSKMLEAA